MKKSISVVLFAAAALLGGCAGKSDPAATAKGITATGYTQTADCSRLDNLSLKPVKTQDPGTVLGWTHLSFKDGSVVSVPAPGMPAWSGKFTCESSMYDGNKYFYTIKTNIGEIGITSYPNEFESTTIAWKKKAAIGDGEDTVADAYMKG